MSTKAPNSKLPRSRSTSQSRSSTTDGHKPNVVASYYQPGTKLVIHAHTPPAAPPPTTKKTNKATVTETVTAPAQAPVTARWEALPHLDIVLSHPPVDTPPPPHKKSHVLNVESLISVKSCEFDDEDRVQRYGGPCLVRCHLEDDPSVSFVAKIYDAIGYQVLSMWNTDCMYRCDLDYSTEAAAYQRMPPALLGATVPGYFGSWTFSLDTGVPAHPRRWHAVRGSDNSPGRESTKHHRPLLSDAERLDMLATVLEVDVQLSHAGIMNQDLAPRNVMVLPSPTRRIVLIDFNLVEFYPPTTDPAELPMNPVDRYWTCYKFVHSGAFTRWVPASWDNDHCRAMEWLMERWAGSAKFAPLPANLGLVLKGSDLGATYQRCYDRIFKTSTATVSHSNASSNISNTSDKLKTAKTETTGKGAPSPPA
ncbi:hypothetical protein B0T24DRAFT_721909 [Lasiosphaeria ovina]|uniref:Protein kinase domain-containing protein n=1 Tax=Lasiosphaeria ovina TaxID=92902 RepID=A0AAE0N2U8_9PEZI|nr:hypothetical protein B0T24DRAFT_721909 [Lasiosphaeria ovina]